MPPREPPIVLEPKEAPTSPNSGGALIFLHGLSDEAAGVFDIGTQLQSSKRLAHIKYIFPNAMENRDMMTTAWYLQSRLTPAPASRPELEDDEDEDGLIQSVKYVESLIEGLVTKDTIPLERIVIGGFSQGMAVSLLLGLVSNKFAGKLGGILAVCGYMPLEKRILDLQSEHEMEKERLPGITKVFVMRGKADALVPKRYHEIVKERLRESGYADSSTDAKEANLTIKEYEGVGHTIIGTMIADIATWLDKVVPKA